MIEAILGKKTTFLSHAYEAGRHRFEDPITSIVFGGLKYVPPQDSFVFFSQFFDGISPSFEADKISLHFWKQLRRRSQRWVDSDKWDKVGKLIDLKRYVEPDLIIEYSGPNGERKYFVIEVKWNSPEGENELRKQWDILNDEIQKEASHVFLVKQKPSECSRTDVTTCLWSRFVAELHHFSSHDLSPQFVVWQDQIVQFLQKVGTQFGHFSGFSSMSNPLVVSDWGFKYFDTSIITSFFEKFIKEQEMASANGLAIKNAAETIISVYNETYALKREISHFLAEEMDESIKEFEEYDWDSDTDGDSESVYTKYLWQYKLTRKGKKKVEYYVTYLLTLLEDQDAFPGMDEPTLHVAIGSQDEFGLDSFVWQDAIDEDEEPNVALGCADKLQIWADPEDDGGAYFSLPLTAIQNRDDIKAQLINPVAAFIRNSWDEIEKGEVEDIFAQADKLLAFEKFKAGVRKK